MDGIIGIYFMSFNILYYTNLKRLSAKKGLPLMVGIFFEFLFFLEILTFGF